MIVERREFIVVDPALTTNPSSDKSAFAWCTTANEVCTVEHLIQYRWETLDLAKEVFSAACPTGNCLGIAGRFIPTIYIEEIGTFETLKKSIMARDLKQAWDIRPIGGHSDNASHAKILRIDLAHKDFLADRIRLNNSRISRAVKSALRDQLLAKDNDYKDADGHDDLADLLGLISKVMHDDPPPVIRREESSGFGGSNLDFIHSLQPKKEDDDPDTGGGSGLACG